MALEFPKRYVRSLQDLGARLLDSRKVGTPSDSFARELLGGFADVCMHAGLEKILVDLGVEPGDRTALVEKVELQTALATQLDAANLDGGGPRNAKPKQVADAIVAALALTLVDEADQTITLDHVVRADVIKAMGPVVEAALAAPQLRQAIVAKARAGCDERYIITFDKIVAQLDDTGLRLLKQPKVPLDASQVVQQLLTDARNAVFGDIGRAALDRAVERISAASPDAAARIDQPVSLKLTPRDVAMLRVADARVLKATAPVIESLLGTVSELARIAWRAEERPVRPYAASQTFAVGELIEHVKFGRGEVKAVAQQRIEVEFSDGKHTLVHVPAKK